MKTSDVIIHCQNIIKDQEMETCEVVEILSKNLDEYQVLLVSVNDSDLAYRMSITNMSESYERIPDWDYSIDSYLFDDLEHGFEIAYMPLKQHAVIWRFIHEYHDDIEYQKGLHHYLQYCKINQISQNLLMKIDHRSVDMPDVMKYYEEVNQGYKVIDEYSIGHQTIVLGYHKKSPSPFATWRTTKNRIRGYDMGHYFTNYKDAFQDFKERSLAITEDYISHIEPSMKNKKSPVR